MSNIKRFKDKDGNYIYPITHASAVFSDDGVALNDCIDDIRDDIQNVADSLSDVTEYKAYDFFSGPNGKVDISDCGQRYLHKGTTNDEGTEQICYFVNDNGEARISMLGNAYMSLRTENNIQTAGVSLRFDEGDSEAIFALVITNDNDSLPLHHLLHLIFNRKSWHLQIRIPELEIDLNPAVVFGTFSEPLKSDGTIYTCELSVDRLTRTAYIKLPDGNTASYYMGEYMEYLCGARAYWQVIATEESDAQPVVKSVWLTEQPKIDVGSERYNFAYQTTERINKKIDSLSTIYVPKHIFSFTPEKSGWVRIFEANTNYLFDGELHLYTKELYDNRATDIKLNISSLPFGKTCHITTLNNSVNNGGIITDIRVGNNGSTIHCVDICIRSIDNPKPIYIEITGEQLLRLNSYSDIFKTEYEPIPLTNNSIYTIKNDIFTTKQISCKNIKCEYNIISSSTSVNIVYSTTIFDNLSSSISCSMPSPTTNDGCIHTILRVDNSEYGVTLLGYFENSANTLSIKGGVTKLMAYNGLWYKL